MTTLRSLVNATDNLYEIVIVDDHSDEETRLFIDGLRLEESLNCRLTKTRNPQHSWTNKSWNTGVSLATGDYIAVVNSDITLSSHWDSELQKVLRSKTIACPYEKMGDKLVKLDPLIEQVQPGMIKGACYMFDARAGFDLFPIPEFLVHWCGDNYLADRASRFNGVGFTKSATITHGTTHSGRLIDRKLFNKTVHNDVVEYQKWSKRDMSLILEQIA